MLIPFGILAAAGAGNDAAFELIGTVLSTSGGSSVTFSSIPQDYKHLQIRYTAKKSSTSTDIAITWNGVNQPQYLSYTMIGGTSVSSTNPSPVASYSALLPNGSAASTNASVPASGIIDIANYTSTTASKTFRALYGYQDGSTYRPVIAVGGKSDPNAITEITISAVSGTFVNSRFSLYGIKG